MRKKNKHVLTTVKKGLIKSLCDGIAEVSGLLSVQSGELLRAGNNYGLVLNLQRSYISVIMLSEDNLSAGDTVVRLYELLKIPTTIGNLGILVDAIGLEYKNLVLKKQTIRKCVEEDFVYRGIELNAPGIIERQSVYESLITGIRLIDSIIPVGLGQRELVIGDKKLGKTSIVLDAVLLRVESNNC